MPRHYNHKTFVGDVKNPLAIGKKGELWKNLDSEYFQIYELYRWIKSGLLDLKLQDLDAKTAIGIRYLIEANYNG